MPRACTCPKDGSFYCPDCLALAERAGLVLAPGSAVMARRAQDDTQVALAPESAPGTIQGPFRGISEEMLLGNVRRLALENGWIFYHTHRSTRSDPGYCDCTIAKPGRPLYIWELKTATGKLTQAQAVWLDFLRQVTGVEAACYRPADWSTMVAKLTEKTV